MNCLCIFQLSSFNSELRILLNLRVELCSAVFAEFGLGVVATIAVAFRTDIVLLLLVAVHSVGVGNIGRNDSGRHGNDGIAKQHHKAGYEPAHRRYRSHIAIAHRSDRYDSPINAVRNVGKLCSRHPALNGIHNRSHGNNHNQHEHEEHHNLAHTLVQSHQDEVTLLEIVEQLEHTEHADKAEHPEHRQIVRSVEEERGVERQD